MSDNRLRKEEGLKSERLVLFVWSSELPHVSSVEIETFSK